MKTKRRGVHPCTRPQILEYVRLKGMTTRPDIASELGATPVTVSKQVRRLLQEGFLAQEGRVDRRKAGRRPDRLALNPGAGMAIGIDLRPDGVRGALCDFTAQIQATANEPVSDGTETKFLKAVDRAIRRLLKAAGARRVFGIGIALPGPASRDREVSLSMPYCDTWLNVPLRKTVEDKFSIITRIEEGSNAGALACHWLDRRENDSGLICLDMRYGIGAGLVISGEIWRGSDGAAGEIGHVVVDPNGPRCYCGNRGCVEQLVLGETPIEKALALKKRGAQSAMFENGDPTSAMEIYECAAHGDLSAQKVATECLEYLAMALGTFICIFNPSDVIVVTESDALAKVAGECLEPLSRSHTYPALYRSTRFSVRRVDDHFFAEAAAVLILKEMFSPDVDVIALG